MLSESIVQERTEEVVQRAVRTRDANDHALAIEMLRSGLALGFFRQGYVVQCVALLQGRADTIEQYKPEEAGHILRMPDPVTVVAAAA